MRKVIGEHEPLDLEAASVVQYLMKGTQMYFALDAWLLPAIASGSSSYLVSLAWERIRAATAPSGSVAAFLTALSFLMGGICAYLRHSMYSTSLENNIIIMYIVGASTTYLWLLMRRHFTWMRRRGGK